MVEVDIHHTGPAAVEATRQLQPPVVVEVVEIRVEGAVAAATWNELVVVEGRQQQVVVTPGEPARQLPV